MKTAPGDHGLSSSLATMEAVVCFEGASVCMHCVGTRLGLCFAVCGLQLALWAADIPEGSSEQVAALSLLAVSKMVYLAGQQPAKTAERFQNEKLNPQTKEVIG